MSINSSSLITDGLLLDETEPPSLKTATDRTDPRGQQARIPLVPEAVARGTGAPPENPII